MSSDPSDTTRPLRFDGITPKGGSDGQPIRESSPGRERFYSLGNRDWSVVDLREPTVQERNIFNQERDEFVAAFDRWQSHPPSRLPRSFDQLSRELNRMSEVLQGWIDMERTWNLQKCFFPKCRAIKDALISLSTQITSASDATPDERYDQQTMYEQIAFHIGSLTLCTSERADANSIKYTELTQELDENWQLKWMQRGDSKPLFEFWTSLHLKIDGCRCRECT